MGHSRWQHKSHRIQAGDSPKTSRQTTVVMNDFDDDGEPLKVLGLIAFEGVGGV